METQLYESRKAIRRARRKFKDDFFSGRLGIFGLFRWWRFFKKNARV